MNCRSRIRRQGSEEHPRRLVEGKWRPPVDKILGKKCVFIKSTWLLLTASEGKRVILE